MTEHMYNNDTYFESAKDAKREKTPECQFIYVEDDREVRYVTA